MSCHTCHCDDGYDLPELKVHWHKLDVDHKKAWGQFDGWGQAQLLREDAQGLAQGAAIKRESIALRVAKAKELVEAEPNKHWLLWHDLEAERDLIERVLPQFTTVYGSMDLEARETAIMEFSRGKIQHLAGKPSIMGSGCNFQHYCADAIFLGVGYKFNDFIQACHRIARFQQKRQVNIHIIFLDSEATICEELKKKWRNHDALMERMTDLLKKHKLSNLNNMELIRALGCERTEVKGDNFRAIRNDCILETQTMEANSVDMICTSIPFGNQYEYSPNYADLGHNAGDKEFFEQMDFLVPELLRILRPGRVAAIHVKDRILFGNVTGFAGPTVNPFSDKTSEAFRKHGFVLLCRITIDTDVVRENNQTYRLGWSENAKDSSKMGAGMPEYVLVFRKLPSDLSNAYADTPVTKLKGGEMKCLQCGFVLSAKEIEKSGEGQAMAFSQAVKPLCPRCDILLTPVTDGYTRADWQIDAAGLWRSNGNRLPDPEDMLHWSMDDIKAWWVRWCLAGGYSHEEHVEVAKALEKQGKLPSSFMLFPPISRNKDIWTDIARMRTLNMEQARRGEEMHVCPLQLDIIKRLITRYTNKGDIVLDPFGGIMSVPYQALKMERKGWGIELCEEYWRCGVGYCEMVESQMGVPTLFDLPTVEREEQAV